ncbi:MAG: hypothetical protein ACD_22C00138G0004 [uncultured bacterium]|nr:MAG: hypothetical protein ACD_22C00138G0004 [uncultured bacterium]
MNNVISLLLSAVITTNTALAAPKPDNFIQNTTEDVVLNVPFIHQVDDLPEDKKAEIRSSACGPSALTMVFNYMGKDLSLYEVIEKLPTSVYIKGSMFYKLNDGPESFGLKAVSFKNSPKAIYDHLKNQKPIVMNVQNYDGITGHAIVVVGIKGFDGTTAKSLVVHDPWTTAYKEYEYVTPSMLKQPEGYNLPIGTIDPFIVE